MHHILKRVALALAGIGLSFAVSAQVTPVPLGVYVGNVGDAPSGNYPGFDAQWDGFVSVMGRTPTFNLTFMDQSVGAPDNGSFPWTSQGSFFSGIMKGDSRTVNAIPVIGLPFGYDTGGGATNFFAGLTAGTYDSQITGMLAAWKANGYTNLYIRPAWEFNIGVNYPVTGANVASFISAWKHVYTTIHTYCAANGIAVKIIWDPNVGQNQNDVAVTVAQQYPGDAFVDLFGIDTYGSPVDGGHDNVSQTTTDPTQYLVSTMLSMAATSGKRVVFNEVGGRDQPFATSMIQALNTASVRRGVGIEFFTMWDIDDGSGNLSWTNPIDAQSALAAIWVGGFGANGSVVNGAPVSSNSGWSAVQSVNVAGMTHGHMSYQVLLLNYTGSGTKSPILVYEHENSEGDKCYDGSAPCTTLTASLANGGSGVDDWYGHNTTFQNRYCNVGCIIVSVAADQTSDPSGQTSNFGGYQDTPGSEPNERGVIAVIQTVLATLNADPNRVYVTGDSLGGIGSQAIALDYGIKTGSVGQIVTAVMPFSGAVFRGGVTAPTNAQTAQISGGPWQFSVNGVTDTSTSSNPTLWVEPVWRAITGNSSYPGQPLGGRAGSTSFFLMVDTSLGHDVWDTYRNFPKAQPLLDGLFAQTGTGGSTGGGGGTLTGTTKSVLPPGYFKAVGNQIQDGSGNNVRLACTGYNSQTANKPSDMAIIRTQGFNCVRVPWYDALDFPGGVASFGRMDTIVNAATGQNLRVILDHHSNEGVSGNNFCTSQQANGLWYDKNSTTPVAGITWNSTDNFDGCGTSGTVTYAQFKANWVAWVNHYKTNQTVMAADFDNEPTTYCHLNNGSVGNSCGAKWGSNDGTDMKAAVNDVGAAILAVNPNWLISVTGIINSGNLFNGTVKGSAAYPVTVGEPMDLSTVQSNPLTCCTGQVIFSIHEYPTSISGQQPDSGPNATTLRNAAWGLVVKNNFAPLFIGELGASLDGTNGATNLADEQAWATGITQYINGQLGGQGAPTFSGCQQPISTDWWNFGNNAGEAPDGTLNPDGTSKSGQQAFWSTLLFTTCSTQSTGGGGGGGGPVTTAWNPLDMSNITLTASNTVATNTAAGISGVRSTTSQSTGKRCFEVAATAITPNWDIGIANQTYTLNAGAGLGGDTNGIGFDPNSAGGNQGIFFGNAPLSSSASTPSVTGDKATICADLDAKMLWATSAAMRTAGNTWNNSASANPATATGGLSFAGMTCPCFIAFNSNEAGSSATINATGSFAVATPTGFVAWQTTATGGKPVILIFGANDNFPKYANDDGPEPFMMDLKR